MMKNIRLLSLHNFLSDFRLQEAFLVIYFAQVTQSYTQAMAVLALTTVTAMLSEIPSGVFSDRMGRRLTLIWGSVCAVIKIVCWAFAQGPLMLFTGAVFSGFSQSLFSGNNQALLYETLKGQGQEAEFHHYKGTTSSMFQLGLGLSALLASFLVPQGLRFIFILGIIPQLLSAAVACFFEEPKTHIAAEPTSIRHFVSGLRKTWHNPRLRLLAIGHGFTYGTGEACFNFSHAFINSLWPGGGVALYRAINHAVGFTGFRIAGRAIDTFKNAAVMIAAEIYWLLSHMLSVGMALTGFGAAAPFLYLSGALFFGPSTVAHDQLQQRQFSDEERATMGSIISFFASLMFAVTALILGSVADAYGLIAAVVTGTLMQAFAIPVYARYKMAE